MIPQNTISDTALSVRPRCSIQVPRDVCIRTVCFERKDDQGYCEHDLNDAATVQSSHLTGASLCRMCAIRLNIPMLERLLLLTFIEDAEQGWRNAYTYGELARIVGRGIHSVETAVSNLRKAGFLTSSRISRSGSYVLFNIDEFLRWGESRVYGTEAPAGISETPQTAECLSQPPAPAPREVKPRRAKRVKAPVAAPAPTQSAPSAGEAEHPVDVNLFFDTFSPDDHPDWPDVPGNWRALKGVPMPGTGNYRGLSIPVGQKPWLGPVPKNADGTFDEEKLRRYPIELMDLDGEEFHARMELDRPIMTEDTPIAVDDEPVDPRPEIEATLRAAGGRKPQAEGDDNLDFSSGTDTDESDMDPSVPINENI